MCLGFGGASRIHLRVREEIHMSASARPMSSSTLHQRDRRRVLERLWRSAGIQFLGLFIIGYVIYGDQPHVGASADALVAFYDGDRARILIAAVSLRPVDPQPPVVRSGAQDHIGGCGARRLGRGGDRLQRSGRRAVPPGHRVGRHPRVLAGSGERHAHIGPERLRRGPASC